VNQTGETRRSMWDIREPVNVIDDTGTRRIVVTAGVRNQLIPYVLNYRMSDNLMFSNILFERDALPGPDGYAVYRAALRGEEKAKRGVGRALFYLRQIVGAVDGVMADWEHEKSAELVPTTIGQWAERAIIELAALRGEEGQ